jgi:hypothetical protein
MGFFLLTFLTAVFLLGDGVTFGLPGEGVGVSSLMGEL